MELIDELNQIEFELEKEGDKPEVRKKFWKVIGKIKRMNIDQVDDSLILKTVKIRNKLFKKNILMSRGKGITLFSLGFITSFTCLYMVYFVFPLPECFYF